MYTSFEMEQVLICPLKAVHLCLASNFTLTKNWARNANLIRQENLIFTETSKEKEKTKSLSPIDPNCHVELFMAQQCSPDVFHSHVINVRLRQQRSILDF